ncbi:MAG: MlaD family protein [Planctomycetota bacterium]
MGNRLQEFRIGVVALVIAAVGGLLATVNTGVSLGVGASPYTLAIRTDRAPGVGPNTPVRKDGVLIGRVESIDFLPEGGVLVTAKIQPGAPIYRSDLCRIRPTSLFGDAVIDFAYGAPNAVGAPEPIEPGSMVRGEALPDPIEALTSLQVDVTPTLASIGEAADAVAELTGRFNRVLGDDFNATRVNGLMDEVSASLADFNRTMEVMQSAMTQVDRLVSDPELQEGVKQVPDLLADARVTVTTATETLESFSGVVTSAEMNLRNLEGLTAPLGERGPELSQQLVSAAENLDLTLNEASRFVQAVTNSQGSLNRFLTDPELFDSFVTVVGNANVVLVRFDETLRQLRPILHDVRVATDKVAREPGRVIGGAFNNGVGLK